MEMKGGKGRGEKRRAGNREGKRGRGKKRLRGKEEKERERVTMGGEGWHFRMLPGQQTMIGIFGKG